MIKIHEKIALFDMDNTLCDYTTKLINDLNCIRAPEEPVIHSIPKNSPEYLTTRMNLIKTPIDWWAKLPKLQLGFDLWDLIGDMGWRRMILTQGPKNTNAWTGKKIWIDNNLGTDIDVTITLDKGLVYGKILVDDWPDYILKWLKWRPRGLVIMPASEHNLHFSHKQVIRYDRTNLKEIINKVKSL